MCHRRASDLPLAVHFLISGRISTVGCLQVTHFPKQIISPPRLGGLRKVPGAILAPHDKLAAKEHQE
jgi:hypothetical protein